MNEPVEPEAAARDETTHDRRSAWLALAWVALFCGRWLYAQAAALTGAFSDQATAALDSLLLIGYVLLVMATAVVLALRAIHGSRGGAESGARGRRGN